MKTFEEKVGKAISKITAQYQLKIKQQETLELELQESITRKRGRREDNAPERAEIAIVRARKQCYVQTIVDIECLFD